MTRFVAACIALLLSAYLSTSAHATSSLSFEGGGYWIDFEIGYVTRPVIASLRFYAPGDSKAVLLRGNFQVRTLDTKRRIPAPDLHRRRHARAALYPGRARQQVDTGRERQADQLKLQLGNVGAQQRSGGDASSIDHLAQMVMRSSSTYEVQQRSALLAARTMQPHDALAC
nr:hypothetical protein [Xanthomonas euvesicatoria]